MKLEFWLDGPAASGRPRINNQGGQPRLVVSREVSEYRHEILKAYRLIAGDRPPFRGLVAMSVILYGQLADVDNVAKVAQDALNKEAFVDDRQIKQLLVRAEDRELTPIRTVTKGARKGQQEGGGLAHPKPGAYVGIRVVLESWAPEEQTA